MVDRIISPDTRRKNASGGRVVLYSILGLLAIAVVLSSFILADMNQKYLNSKQQSNDFAHNISTMCQIDNLDDKYPEYCVDAKDYLKNPADDQSKNAISLSDIKDVYCEGDKLILEYTNGKREEIQTTCE